MVNTNGREEQGGGSIRARQKWYYCSPEILFPLPLSLLGHRNEMLLFDILPWLVCGQLAEWLGCKRRQLTDDNRIKGARLGGISLFSSALWSPHDLFFLLFIVDLLAQPASTRGVKDDEGITWIWIYGEKWVTDDELLCDIVVLEKKMILLFCILGCGGNGAFMWILSCLLRGLSNPPKCNTLSGDWIKL